MEALLHVNNLRGWGHPLVELPGNIMQVGVQALLQGLVEDNLAPEFIVRQGQEPVEVIGYEGGAFQVLLH